MKNLIIDATSEQILFKIITDNESYTSVHVNSRENFDKFVDLLFKFFKNNKIEVKEIDNILINQGPGNFSGIRTSIAIAKGLSVTNNLNLYGFNSKDVKNQNYDKILDLFSKGILIKNLIKPQYSS